MKTSTVLFGFAACALLASCNVKENPVSAPDASQGRTLTFGATVGSPLTKAHFDDASAPVKYILWDATDQFDFHSIALKDGEEVVTTTSATPDNVSEDGKTVFFNKDAEDFMVITYPAGAVTLKDSVVNVKTDTVRTETLRIVEADVPAIQPLSSTLSPNLVPMTSAKLAVSDAGAAFDKEAAIAFSTPVDMYPLAGIVKMTLTGLPDVTSAKVTRIAVMSEFTGANKELTQGLWGKESFALVLGEDGVPTLETLSKYITGSNDYIGDTGRLRIDLVSEEGQQYTSEKGLDACFIVSNSYGKMKTMRVSVYTSDGAVYQKKFTLDNNIAFNKSKVSVFTLDFTSDTEVKKADSAYSVEWSEGYLVYDKDNAAYKIGTAESAPLYFKFGSAMGMEFYASTEEYIHKLKPDDANVPQTAIVGGVERQIGVMTPDGQTQSNGSCYFITTNQPSAGVVAAWRNRASYSPKDGKIVVDTIRTYTDFQTVSSAATTTAFAGETDPCSYVKVAAGEKAWRMPTLDEINDLINNGAVGIEFLNSDSTFPTGNYDGKLKQVRYADGPRTLVFSAYGSVAESYASKGTVYKLQMLYSNKYAVRFWSSSYASKQGSAYNLSLSSTPSYTTKPSVSKYSAGNSNANTPEGLTYGDLLPVRCVRDK